MSEFKLVCDYMAIGNGILRSAEMQAICTEVAEGMRANYPNASEIKERIGSSRCCSEFYYLEESE